MDREIQSVPPFIAPLASAPPDAEAPARHCLAACRLRLSADSYSRDTPGLWFLKHLANHAKHRPTTGGHQSLSRISPSLSSDSHVAQEIHSGSLAVCLKLPPEHSFLSSREKRFRPIEAGRIGLPVSSSELSQFGIPSPSEVTGKRFEFTPFIVELFATERLTQIPEAVPPPTRLVTKVEAPDASVVKRASQPGIPTTGFAPALFSHGLSSLKGFSPSPGFNSLALGRSQGLFCRHGRDYTCQPPSNRTSQSPGIRLYGYSARQVVSLLPSLWLVAKGNRVRCFHNPPSPVTFSVSGDLSSFLPRRKEICQKKIVFVRKIWHREKDERKLSGFSCSLCPNAARRGGEPCALHSAALILTEP